MSKPVTLYASNRGAEYHRVVSEAGGPAKFKSVVLWGIDNRRNDILSLTPRMPRGLEASRPSKGWSDIHIPSKPTMYRNTRVHYRW